MNDREKEYQSRDEIERFKADTLAKGLEKAQRQFGWIAVERPWKGVRRRGRAARQRRENQEKNRRKLPHVQVIASSR